MQPRFSILASTLLLVLGGGWGAHAAQDPTPGSEPAAAEAARKPAPQSGTAKQDWQPTRAERILAKQREVEVAQRELAYAKIEITLAEMKTESDLATAERAVLGAERELARAEEALAGFSIAFDAGLAATRLKVSRADNSLTVASADLAGILDIYAEEQEARAKKEIIRRHKAAVRFAEQGVAIAGLEAKKKIEFDLPREKDGLGWEIEKAKAGLETARAALARTQLAGELELTRARDAELAAKHKVVDLKRVHKRLKAGPKKAAGRKQAPKNGK